MVSEEIMQRPVLPEALIEIASLNGLNKRSAVRRVKKLPVLVERQTVAVQPSLAEQFELLRDRMIPPTPLLKFDAANVAGRRAAVDPIQPAVWTPRQMVGHGLRVFHA